MNGNSTKGGCPNTTSNGARVFLGVWNVRTLRGRERLRDISLALEEMQIDVCGLCEVRRAGVDSALDGDYAFLWAGHPVGDDDWLGGVGLALRLSFLRRLGINLQDCVIAYSRARVMAVRIPRVGRLPALFLISAYAPTMAATDVERDEFYEHLSEAMSLSKSSEHIWCMGDFNGRVGNKAADWPGVLGQFGIQGENKGGLSLLEFCTAWRLRITNTFFHLPQYLINTWKDNRSKTWRCLDYFIVKQEDAGIVRSAVARRRALRWSDHCLVSVDIQLKSRQWANKKGNARKRKSKVDVLQRRKATVQHKMEDLLACVVSSHDPQCVDSTQEALFKAAVEALGSAKRTSPDWFIENEGILLPLIEAKREATSRWIADPCALTKNVLPSCRRLVKAAVQGCKNNFWQQKATRMQKLADGNDLLKLYKEIREIECPPKAKTAHPVYDELGDGLLVDADDILQRKAQYTRQLLSQVCNVYPNALEELDSVPEATDMAASPSFEEVEAAIAALKNNKCAGQDGVPSEVWKYGGVAVTKWLHKAIELVWHEEEVPKSWKDAEIFLLWKGKGSKSDLSTYRTIALLATGGKVLTKILQQRIADHAERMILKDSCQWGFRREKSTIQPISILRRLQEHAKEKSGQLHLAFLDLVKAYDSVNREAMWEVLEKFGVPAKIIALVRSFHDGQQARVVQHDRVSESFEIKSGLRQGCVMAPTLFLLFMEAITRRMKKTLKQSDGFQIRTRKDRDFFNVQRFKAASKCQVLSISHLLYADDAVLVSGTRAGLQRIVDAFAEASMSFGLRISIDKTKTMIQGCNGNPTPIQIYGTAIERVPEFTYLGSIEAEASTNSAEVRTRVMKAQSAFGRLWKRVFSRKELSAKTKLMIYASSVMSILSYGVCIMAVYARETRQMRFMHHKHLRSLLGYTWRDKKSYGQLIRESDLEPIPVMLRRQRLRHLANLSAASGVDELPMAVLCGERQSGKRRVGGQKLNFRHVTKRDMAVEFGKLLHNPSDWAALKHKIEQKSID